LFETAAKKLPQSPQTCWIRLRLTPVIWHGGAPAVFYAF
jgi:hypothetical protein